MAQLYTPFIRQAVQDIAGGFDRRAQHQQQAQEKQLFGQAYMGDPQARERLAQMNPQALMQIDQLTQEREQRELSQASTERKRSMEKREMREALLADAAKFDTMEESQAFLDGQREQYPELIGPNAKRLTPETFSQLKTQYGEKPKEVSALDTAKIAKLKQETAKIEKELAKPGTKDSFKNEEKLRNSFLKQTAEFQGQNAAYGRIQASAKDPSAAGDLALIFNYMKMLDPGSTVREGEFATAQNSGGWDDTVRAMYNKARSGERLSKDIRVDFVDRADRLFAEATTQHGVTRGVFSDLATRYGLSPENVTINVATANVEEGLSTLSDEELLDL